MSSTSISNAELYKLIMNDMNTSWKNILFKDTDVKNSFIICLNELKNRINKGLPIDKVCPKVNQIFNVFKYFDFDELKVIIIGQDPYYTPNTANGLCFSSGELKKLNKLKNNKINDNNNQINKLKQINKISNNSNQINIEDILNNNKSLILDNKLIIDDKNKKVKKVKKVKLPASLRWIYSALIKSNFIENMPNHSNLETWAKQGVLLLNRFLTTEEGKAKQHTFWSKFTDEVIKCISKNSADKIFLLWGKDAQKLGKFINNKHHILEYGHPSPLARRYVKFENCPNFIETNEILRKLNKKEINWGSVNKLNELNNLNNLKNINNVENINNDELSNIIHIFTDGSAVNNGKSYCNAAYAFVIVYDNKIIYDESDNLKNCKEIKIATSPKSELIGVIRSLEYLNELKNLNNDKLSNLNNDELSNLQNFKINIYCDNLYTVKTINTWGESWIKKGIINHKKNPLLVIRLLELKKIINNKFNELNVIHINSHTKEPINKDSYEWFKWYYNDIVDLKAKDGLKK